MAPPGDTPGPAAVQQPQTDARSAFRDGTKEDGWFYPTPAALAAAASAGAKDVRGTVAARHRSSSDIPTRDSIFDAHAGNAEAYYPHFQFDSNYTYGMVHRE